MRLIMHATNDYKCIGKDDTAFVSPPAAPAASGFFFFFFTFPPFMLLSACVRACVRKHAQ